MKCKKIRTLLSVYLDNYLNPVLKEEVEKHLSGCPDCSTYLKQLQESLKLLGEVGAPQFPDELHARIMERIRVEEDLSPKFSWRPYLYPVLAGAAAVLLFWLTRTEQPQPEKVRTAPVREVSPVVQPKVLPQGKTEVTIPSILPQPGRKIVPGQPLLLEQKPAEKEEKVQPAVKTVPETPSFRETVPRPVKEKIRKEERPPVATGTPLAEKTRPPVSGRAAPPVPTGEFKFKEVAPSPFTPNGDGQNDQVYFYFDNPQQQEVKLSIYNLGGRLVKKITVTPQIVPFWDGLDNTDNPVPGGAYLYYIEVEGQTYKGTVILAR